MLESIFKIKNRYESYVHKRYVKRQDSIYDQKEENVSKILEFLNSKEKPTKMCHHDNPRTHKWKIDDHPSSYYTVDQNKLFIRCEHCNDSTQVIVPLDFRKEYKKLQM